MKKIKRNISLAVALITVINTFIFSTVHAFAHESILSVDYDNCSTYEDSDFRTWYILYDEQGEHCHLSHQDTTIKYYFEETSEDGTFRWTDIATEDEVNMLKNAYANSMKKWNNVYYYSYDSSGTVTKHKIINVVEGTLNDHNISIYPISNTNSDNVVATNLLTGTTVDDSAGTHSHHYNWKMSINVDMFLTDNESLLNAYMERCGAHELGHVLGLSDVDELCTENASDDHHFEILMGYGEPYVNRSQNITYKDIAGVAITRGFHTDDDHKWLITFDLEGYKLICSICNGVRRISQEEISDYSHDPYGSCLNNHELSSGNMMAVASYGTTDYYKCKYCRYVAPFTSNVDQSYTKANYSSSQHKCTNTVEGLEYSFFENHIFSYIGYSSTQHRKRCGCGYSTLLYHVILDSSATIKTCIYCKAIVESGGGAIIGMALGNISYITENGSYIRPDGVIVISDIDYELLMNGELDIYALACNHDAE